MAQGYPVGAAQRMVLNALRLTAADFEEANRIFAQHGLEVTSKRVGRSSVPVIRRLAQAGGAFNAYGEGETWQNSFKPVDLAAVAQWLA